MAAYWEAFKGSGLDLFLLAMTPLVVIYVIDRIMRAWKRRKELPPPQKTPGIEFLEDALKEDEVRKPNPSYSYAQFKDDLYNKGLTFDEIYEKCGGVFPQKPREPETLAPPKEGDPKDDEDRFARLQVWFQQRGETARVFKKLVAPPPNVYPLIQWRNRRR